VRAILAIDSFKGCLSSSEAEKAAARAFDRDDTVIEVPVSDGGEGFSEILTSALGGKRKTARVHDPMGNPIDASYGIVHGGEVAVIDIASASGLTLVPEQRRNPLYASSYGSGELISDAIDEGVESIWIGMGGSATCDAGIGMLQALGYRFSTPSGMVQNPVLANITSIDPDHRHRGLSSVRFTVFHDVAAPLYGRGGAALSYSMQKGAGQQMALSLDGWLYSISALYSRYCGFPVGEVPGAGAAGGIGAAAIAVLHAKAKNGIEGFLDIVDFQSYLEGPYILVTGEGKTDRQTLQGKTPLGVLEYVRDRDPLFGRDPSRKAILLAGKVEDEFLLREAGFDSVIQVTPEGTPLSLAMEKETAKRNITESLRGALKCLSGVGETCLD